MHSRQPKGFPSPKSSGVIMTLLIRIETSQYGLVTAKINDDPELQATDPTRDGAVRALKQKLQTMIEMGKLSSIEVDVPMHRKQA